VRLLLKSSGLGQANSGDEDAPDGSIGASRRIDRSAAVAIGAASASASAAAATAPRTTVARRMGGEQSRFRLGELHR
jgi:hypothetical protein